MHLKWTRQSDGIYTAPMDANLDIDQLFVNGTRQLMARYPNVRQGERYNVFDAWQLNVDDKADEQMQDALSPERTRCACGMYEHQPAQLYALYGLLFCSIKLNEVAQTHRFHLGACHVGAFGWEVIQFAFTAVIEPLAWGIKFLLDILHLRLDYIPWWCCDSAWSRGLCCHWL